MTVTLPNRPRNSRGRYRSQSSLAQVNHRTHSTSGYRSRPYKQRARPNIRTRLYTQTPSRNRWPKVSLISDSIGKKVNVPHLAVQAVSGLYVEKAERYLRLNINLNVKDYDIIILHIGTVDLKFLSITEFATKYEALINRIKTIKESALVAISGILQRPKDFRTGSSGNFLDEKRKSFNSELKRICVWHRLSFCQSWKRFQQKDNPSEPDYSLFKDTWYDGVHLNDRGGREFSRYLEGVA